jgi:Ni,Fe-hydrogenase maturation factor
LALLAVKKLGQMGWQSDYPQHQITYETLDRPGPALLDCMQGADFVFVLDELVSDHAPGEVEPLTPGDIIKDEWVMSGNSLGVAETIALGSVIGELPDSLLLLGLAVRQDGGLSSGNAEIYPATMASIQQHIVNRVGLVEY